MGQASDTAGIFRIARGITTPVQLAAGETLFHQGDVGDAAFFLEKGLLEVSVLSSEGQKLPLATIAPGRIVGEIALLTDLRRTATVTALQPSTLGRIGRAALLGEIERSPELALALLDMAGRRLAEANSRLEDQVFRPVPARLARLLLRRYRDDAGGEALMLWQKDMADHLGVTREAVTKCIGQWKRAGWVRTGRGKIWIADPEALDRVANGAAD